MSLVETIYSNCNIDAVNGDLEISHCSSCGETSSEVLFLAKDPRSKQKGNCSVFGIFQCTRCGLIRVNPRPTAGAISRFYSETYYDVVSKAVTKSQDRPYGIWFAKQIGAQMGFDIINRRHIDFGRFEKGLRLLDVGCGTGSYLEAVEQKISTIETTGIDPNAKALEIAKQRTKARLYQCDLLTLPSSLGLFDVVTLWDVLEHTHDPLQNLKSAYSILKPNGLIAVDVPNIGSLSAKLFGRFWFHLDVPRHLYFFSKRTLCDVMKHAGFVIDKVFYPFTSCDMTFSMELWLRETFDNRCEYRPIWASWAKAFLRMLDISRLIRGPSIRVNAIKPND